MYSSLTYYIMFVSNSINDLRKLIEWCAAADLPIHILLTKCDKLGRGKRLQALRDADKFLQGMPRATTQLFSAPQSIGVDEARERIAELLSKKA